MLHGWSAGSGRLGVSPHAGAPSLLSINPTRSACPTPLRVPLVLSLTGCSGRAGPRRVTAALGPATCDHLSPTSLVSGGRPMRNLLAFLAAAVLAFVGLGWYLDWYKVQSVPSTPGHQSFTVEVNGTK